MQTIKRARLTLTVGRNKLRSLTHAADRNYIVVINEEGGVMRAQIVQIGNSQGIRLPKALLEQTGLSGEVELKARDNEIVIRPLRKPREGWDEAFRAMAQNAWRAFRLP